MFLVKITFIGVKTLFYSNYLLIALKFIFYFLKSKILLLFSEVKNTSYTTKNIIYI